MESSWQSFFEQTLHELRQHHRLRMRGGSGRPERPAPSETACARSVPQASPGTCRLDFGSNDYLGLRQHPEVVHAFRCAGAIGSGASPVLRGYASAHRELEAELAQWSSQKPASALVFSSGYSCNLGVISCLADAGDLILSDRLNHASLIDGCRLSRAAVEVFPHCDAEFVDDYLGKHRHRFRRVLVITESVFSMDGDVAPLRALADVANRHGAGLIVDEAHAVGVYGRRGCGMLEELDCQSAPLLKLGTLSKALGAVGGYAIGDPLTIEFLVNRCRSYIFSTAPSPAILCAARTSLRLLQQMQTARRELRAQSTYARQQIRALGVPVPEGDAPIIPVILHQEDRVLDVARHLQQQGVHVPAIRPPTVPVGASRLRISLSSTHTREDVDRLIEAMRTALCG